MSNYDDRLKDYVDVKERVRLFYEKFPDGRLITWRVRATRKPDDVPRVWVEAKAYRTPDDHHPTVGWSWIELPGKTPYTRGSEIENAETSAWGRAIGALGIGIEKSIASGDEVRNKAEPVTPASVNASEVERLAATVPSTDDGGLIGTATTKGTQDFELRQTPEGWTLPFRVKNGNKSFIVLAEGKLAEALATLRPRVLDQRVTVWGHWTDEVTPAKGTKPEIRYRILHLERIETPDGTLPPADEPPDAVALPFEGEALPEPMFDAQA